MRRWRRSSLKRSQPNGPRTPKMSMHDFVQAGGRPKCWKPSSSGMPRFKWNNGPSSTAPSRPPTCAEPISSICLICSFELETYSTAEG